MHLSVCTVHLGEVDSRQLPQESMMLYILCMCVCVWAKRLLLKSTRFTAFRKTLRCIKMS